MGRTRSGRYSDREVRRLIESYAEAKEQRGTQPGLPLDRLVRLADLDRALQMLPLRHWEVVLLHGLLGISQDETARLLQVSQQAVAKRYRYGVEAVHFHINGGLI